MAEESKMNTEPVKESRDMRISKAVGPKMIDPLLVGFRFKVKETFWFDLKDILFEGQKDFLI